jgi:hypothetical protein
MVIKQSHQTSNNIDLALLAEQLRSAHRKKALPRCSKCGSFEHNARYVALDTMYFIVIEPILMFFYKSHQKSDGILRGSLVKYVSSKTACFLTHSTNLLGELILLS